MTYSETLTQLRYEEDVVSAKSKTKPLALKDESPNQRRSNFVAMRNNVLMRSKTDQEDRQPAGTEQFKDTQKGGYGHASSRSILKKTGCASRLNILQTSDREIVSLRKVRFKQQKTIAYYEIGNSVDKFKSKLESSLRKLSQNTLLKDPIEE